MTSEFSIAVHCLVYLSHKNCSQSSESIADNVCTNPARIRKILAKLKKEHLVQTKEGLSGGFRLGRDAASIYLSDVLNAVGEQPVTVSWRTGEESKPCRIASGMAGAMDALYDQLNRDCMARLRTYTVADIERKLFT